MKPAASSAIAVIDAGTNPLDSLTPALSDTIISRQSASYRKLIRGEIMRSH